MELEEFKWILSSTCSITLWSGITAGIGGVLLSGKKVFNVILVSANTSFQKAAFIGGGSIGAAGATFLFIFSEIHSQKNHSYFKKYVMKNWTWAATLPILAIPYFSGVSLATGITLVVLGALGQAVHEHLILI